MKKLIHIESEDIVFNHRIDSPLVEKLNNRHCHDTYEILYVADGRGRYLIEGVEIEMLPRSLVIARPFEYHFIEVESKSTYERYVIHFNRSVLSPDTAKLLDSMLGEDSSHGRYFSPDALSQTTISVFDRLEYANNLPEKERSVYLGLLLSELLVLLSGTGSQRINCDEDELGARVARYINDYLEMEISLDKLAKYFFVSKYYLCRSFKKYSGVSVHSYINHKRVMYAKQLIDSGETASGAAYRVGFGDYSAFYRAYVKILGKAPTHKTARK